MPPSPQELVQFLFSTVARKAPPVPFALGAGVARYLDELAYSFVGPDRLYLFNLSKVIWGRVFQYAQFKIPDRKQTVKFLERFADTHLAEYEARNAAALVMNKSAPQPRKPSRILRGPQIQISLGLNAKRISNDLTERIYGAYWYARQCKLKNARGFVADALNAHRLSLVSGDSAAEWTGYEVIERVKQHERGRTSAAKVKLRQQAIHKWIALFKQSN